MEQQHSATELVRKLVEDDGELQVRFSCYCGVPHCSVRVQHLSSSLATFRKAMNWTPPSKPLGISCQISRSSGPAASAR